MRGGLQQPDPGAGELPQRLPAPRPGHQGRDAGPGDPQAAGLQVADVDFLRRTVVVRRQIQGQVNSRTVATAPKYESARTVYLPDALVKELATHIEKQPPNGDQRWLFANGPHVWNRNSAGNQWRIIRQAIGMEEFTLHDLRHYYASGVIAAGCDVVTLQHALGHPSPNHHR